MSLRQVKNTIEGVCYTFQCEEFASTHYFELFFFSGQMKCIVLTSGCCLAVVMNLTTLGAAYMLK